jgi:hypothetical protein
MLTSGDADRLSFRPKSKAMNVIAIGNGYGSISEYPRVPTFDTLSSDFEVNMAKKLSFRRVSLLNMSDN